MSSPDSPESRRLAVRSLRIFLPIYTVATATLALPFVLRVRGISSPAASLLGTASLVIMAITAPAFLFWMARLGQYHSRGGLRFRLLPALLHGSWESVSEGPEPGPAPRSPLGALVVEGRAAANDLEAAGLLALAGTLMVVLREAEILRLAADRQADSPDAQGVSEPLLGRVHDLVTHLRNGSGLKEADLSSSLEALLRDLREGNGSLRGSGSS